MDRINSLLLCLTLGCSLFALSLGYTECFFLRPCVWRLSHDSLGHCKKLCFWIVWVSLQNGDLFLGEIYCHVFFFFFCYLFYLVTLCYDDIILPFLPTFENLIYLSLLHFKFMTFYSINCYYIPPYIFLNTHESFCKVLLVCMFSGLIVWCYRTNCSAPTSRKWFLPTLSICIAIFF